MLGPLQDNGGPTETHLPLTGSPVIDAGSPDCPLPATDQRGVARPEGAACDIGAVEVEATNTPPDCLTVTANPNRLWPPNHKLRPVALAGATDPDGDTVTLTITTVTQDEPLDGLGDGDKSPDAKAGTQSNKVLLRAERSGRGDGRVYRVSFVGSDGTGGSCSGVATVGVPKNGARVGPDLIRPRPASTVWTIVRKRSSGLENPPRPFHPSRTEPDPVLTETEKDRFSSPLGVPIPHGIGKNKY